MHQFEFYSQLRVGTDGIVESRQPSPRSFTSFIYRGTRDLSFTRVIRAEARYPSSKANENVASVQMLFSPPPFSFTPTPFR